MAWNTLTTYASGSAVTNGIINGIGNDFRTWGGNVDAGGYGLFNAAFTTLNPGTLPASPANGMLAIDASNVLKQYYSAAWHIVSPWVTTSSDTMHTAGGSYGSIAGPTGNTAGYVTHQYQTGSGLDNLSIGLNWRRTDGSGSIFASAMSTAEMQMTENGAGGAAAIIFGTGAANTAPTERLRIMSVGVGIGMSGAPTAPLQVVGLVTYASDALAGAGGLTAGAFYKDSAGGLHVKL